MQLTADELRAAVATATLAPSVHNSQPWRFAVHDDTIEVFADRSRQLGVIDPTGRELHISCGAAIAFAVIAVRARGHVCTVAALPDPADPDHLARLQVGGHLPPNPEQIALAVALPRRYTDRDRFDETPVPTWLVEALRRVAADVGVWLREVRDADDLVDLAVLLAEADEAERRGSGYQRELRDWGRVGVAPDGIPPTAVPATPVRARGSSLRLRDFDVDAAPDVAPPSEPPPVERPLVVILGTDADDRYAWLQAGQALGRVLATATTAGVAASPLTQVLEVPATRAMLAGRLRLLGHAQMLLRLGYGHGRPTTGRRPVDEVLAD